MHLLDVVRSLLSSDAAEPLPKAKATMPADTASLPDLRDVRGQTAAKRVLEIAPVGRPHLADVGPPPGSGKSMLAHRLAGLLRKRLANPP